MLLKSKSMLHIFNILCAYAFKSVAVDNNCGTEKLRHENNED
jgi:hypothetical protein